MKTVKMNEDAADEKDGNGLKLRQTGLKAHYEVLLDSTAQVFPISFQFVLQFLIHNFQFTI